MVKSGNEGNVNTLLWGVIIFFFLIIVATKLLGFIHTYITYPATLCIIINIDRNRFGVTHTHIPSLTK